MLSAIPGLVQLGKCFQISSIVARLLYSIGSKIIRFPPLSKESFINDFTTQRGQRETSAAIKTKLT